MVIAQRFHVGESTVRSAVKRVMTKKKSARKSRKPAPHIQKRRRLVHALLTAKETRRENVGVTLNKDGRPRKNSRNARLSVTFPTGSLGLCRRALRTKHNICVSATTVRRDRIAVKLNCRKRPKGTVRYEGDAARRLLYIEQNLSFAEQHVDECVFVDEKVFDSNCSQVFCYCKEGDVPPAREIDRYPVSVHVFGMIGVGFKFLHIFDDGESITSEVYREKCLKPCSREMRRRYFVQDNAGAHVGVRSYLADMCTKGIIQHPARSPDMNPIERMWSIIRNRVSSEGPLTRVELVRFIKKCWDEISQDVVNRTCRSWARMMRAVRFNKGETVSKNLKGDTWKSKKK